MFDDSHRVSKSRHLILLGLWSSFMAGFCGHSLHLVTRCRIQCASCLSTKGTAPPRMSMVKSRLRSCESCESMIIYVIFSKSWMFCWGSVGGSIPSSLIILAHPASLHPSDITSLHPHVVFFWMIDAYISPHIKSLPTCHPNIMILQLL